MKVILIFPLILFLTSCSWFPFGMTQQSKEPLKSTFICIADINRDSNCVKVDCDYAQKHCKEFGDRVLVNYVTGMTYFYRLDPLTDLNKCRENALKRR
jgi:hypothetical protein